MWSSRLQTIEKSFNRHPRKVVAVAHRRWSFTTGSNCKALTRKIVFYCRSLVEDGRLRDVVAHGGWTVFLFGTLTYWLAFGNCRCPVTEAIIAQDTNVDLEVNSQGSKRKKKRQIKQQVDDKGYPSKFFPITEKINRYSIIFLSIWRYESLILSSFNPVPKLYLEQFLSQSLSTYLSCLLQRGKTWARTSRLFVRLSMIG